MALLAPGEALRVRCMNGQWFGFNEQNNGLATLALWLCRNENYCLFATMCGDSTVQVLALAYSIGTLFPASQK